MTRRRALAALAGAGLLGGARRSSADEKAQIRYGDDRLCFADLRLPRGRGPHPVAIVVHGGFWRREYGLDLMDAMSSALTAAGLATWNVEYRRVGDSGGGWPGTFHDVGRAADHLRTIADERRLDLSRVVAVGHSAGGHLALWLAARRRVPASSELFAAKPLPIEAAVSLGGIPDLASAEARRLGRGAVRRLLGGGPADYPERYAATSPAALLPFGVRQVLVHGEDDDVVPVEESEAYVAAAAKRGDPARLVTLVGIGHFEPIDPHTRAWPAVERAMLDAVAKRPET